MRRRLLTLLLSWLLGSIGLAQPAARASTGERVQIILVGATGDAAELELLIRELLQRDGVSPEFVAVDRFDPDALLAEPDADDRVHVHVSLATPELARLYLRGPHGRRFLLRDLALRAGLDELGCESIAQVIASATQALLHSGAGLDREAARAGLAEAAPRAATPTPLAPASTRKAAPAPPRRAARFELSARASGAWTGAALHARLGGGAELGVSQQTSRSLCVRGRLVFEQYAAQSLDTRQLSAQVRVSALRLGLDLGGARGPHALFGGVGAGVDLNAIDPETASDPSWMLSEKQVDALPVLRAELRYEWAHDALVLSMGAYADVILGDNQFKLQDAGRTIEVAHPWPVLPGLLLGLGWRSK